MVVIVNNNRVIKIEFYFIRFRNSYEDKYPKNIPYGIKIISRDVIYRDVILVELWSWVYLIRWLKGNTSV